MKSKFADKLIQNRPYDYIPWFSQIKHFSVIYHATKFVVEQVYKEANTKSSTYFLKKCILEFSVTIVYIQVDGTSEFMKSFENKCKYLNIMLWVLPYARSPKFNVNVE